MPATIFDKPIFPGAKIVSAEVTVTNTSGSYSQSFSDDRISASMRAFQIEIDDPSIFNDKISITTANGSFTIACNSVAGETTVNIGFLKIADDPTAVTSTEFTILNNRIGDLDDLETTDQTSMVNAVNEVVGNVSDNSQAIANIKADVPGKIVTMTVPLPTASGVNDDSFDLPSGVQASKTFILSVTANTYSTFYYNLPHMLVTVHVNFILNSNGNKLRVYTESSYPGYANARARILLYVEP